MLVISTNPITFTWRQPNLYKFEILCNSIKIKWPYVLFACNLRNQKNVFQTEWHPPPPRKKNACVLIPVTCEFLKLHGKGALSWHMELKLWTSGLQWGECSRLSQLGTPVSMRDLEWGTGRRKWSEWCHVRKIHSAIDFGDGGG